MPISRVGDDKPVIQRSVGGTARLTPVIGIGPTGAAGPTGVQGPPGPGTGAGAWVALTGYTANQVVQAPDGSIIYRLANGTSRASFDATEAALWGAVSAKSGTIENAAQTDAIVAMTATGYFNVIAYGADPTGAADSGPAINDAIDAAKVSGGTVFVPPGEYLIATAIDLSNIHPAFDPQTDVGVTLMGAGRNATRLVGGETSYGFIEVVGSNRITIQGMSLVGTGSLQYAILGGRTTGDASSGEHTFRDLVIYGSFTAAAVFMVSSEAGTYENCMIYAAVGKAMVLARDRRGWTASAKYTPFTATSIISGGNGMQYLRRVSLITLRDDMGDVPLSLEFVQTFLAESCYMSSTGAPLVTIAKGCHEATFKACHQEYNVGVTGASEPFGFYCINYVTGTEESAVRLTIEGSSVYTVYAEDYTRFVDFTFKGGRWRGTQAYQFDVSLCTNANISYDPAAVDIAEVLTPAYRFRGGGWENQVSPTRMTTAARNAVTWDLGDGRYVYDTTLNKPIWRGPAGWIDASGASV